MPKYAVIDRHGETRGTDLSAREAAEIVLYDDGQDYEIRQTHGRHELWTRQQVANRQWTRTTINSYQSIAEDPVGHVFRQVIARAGEWGGFTVLTMAAFVKMADENQEG